MNTEQIASIALDALDELKGQQISVLDVRGKTDVTDQMIICTGTSIRHVKALANSVSSRCKEAGSPPLGSEGEGQGDWLLIDLHDVVVHIMTESTRSYYALEKLWSVPANSAGEVLEGEV